MQMHEATNSTTLPPPAKPHEVRPWRSMRCFAWDLADAGAENVIAELRENGIDGLHLALAYHGGRFYCPHNPKHAVVHAPEGVVYFKPEPDHYESLRPRVHPEYGSGALAAEVRELCHEYGMTYIGWAPLFNNMALSTWHPEATCLNVLGDRLDGALCPANPEVRAYAAGLVRDLAHEVGVDAIELEDFAYPALENHAGAEWRGIEIGPSLSFLLGLCFCPHCRKRAEEANLEVDDLKRRLERMIRHGLTGDLSERRLEDELSDPHHPLARYGAMRSDVVTSLLDELAEATDGAALLQPMLESNPNLTWHSGVELRELRQLVPRATVVVPPVAPARAQAVLERYEHVLHMGNDMAADLRLIPLRREQRHASEPNVPATIAAVHEAGYDRLILSHYGLAPLDQLEWLSLASRRG
jgi:hypothetical protein